MLYGVYGSFIWTGAADRGAAHPYLINDNNIDRIIFYAKSFTYKYSGVIKAIIDILHGKSVSLETSKPLIGGGGLYKRERTLWHKLLTRNRNQPTRNPPVLPL